MRRTHRLRHPDGLMSEVTIRCCLVRGIRIRRSGEALRLRLAEAGFGRWRERSEPRDPKPTEQQRGAKELTIRSIAALTLRDARPEPGQVKLEVGSGALVWRLQRHDDGPWAMLEGVPTGPGVVPLESFVDVSCATYVVSRWIAVASENIDKSGADALHKGSLWHRSRQREPSGILRRASESIPKYAAVALYCRVLWRGI